MKTKNTKGIRMKTLLAAVAVFAIAPTAFADALKDARSVLREVEGNTGLQPGTQSKAAQLLTDIQVLRADASSTTPQAGSQSWFALLDRVKASQGTHTMDMAAFDPVTQQPVGVRSLLAALPPPTTWKAMHTEAAKRASARADTVDSLAERL